MTINDPSVLTINAGSSSIKFAIFQGDDSPTQTIEGSIERIGDPQCTFEVKGLRQNSHFFEVIGAPRPAAAASRLITWIEQYFQHGALTGIAHRVVHGGPKYSKPCLITAPMLADLRQFSLFDPEHLPDEILLIDTLRRRFPDLPQVACFDTAFHSELPRVARLLPIPRHYEAQGVHRYGFHGLSCEFLLEELARLAGPTVAHGRLVLAHLGSGASLTAVSRGKSIDTSMSFTPTGGVPMGTRSGDLDPGMVRYLAHTEQMTADQFSDMVNFKSGLLGISETSSDMRDLLRLAPSDVRAAEAIAVFCYQVKKYIASLAAALGGVDTLIFAGGIGERSPIIRATICAGLQFLGVDLQEDRNTGNQPIISPDVSPTTVRVIATNEGCVMAKATLNILAFPEKGEAKLC